VGRITRQGDGPGRAEISAKSVAGAGCCWVRCVAAGSLPRPAGFRAAGGSGLRSAFRGLRGWTNDQGDGQGDDRGLASVGPADVGGVGWAGAGWAGLTVARQAGM
jgi:hypothetical protein